MNADYRDLTRTLYEEARRASASIGLECLIGGKPKLAPGTLHTEFRFRCWQSLRVIEGEQQWTWTVGLLQFTIHGPHCCDEEDLQTMGDFLSESFGDTTFEVPERGRLRVEPMEATVLPSSRGRKGVAISDAAFDYYRPTI